MVLRAEASMMQLLSQSLGWRKNRAREQEECTIIWLTSLREN
jgi:hypothetical protein